MDGQYTGRRLSRRRFVVGTAIIGTATLLNACGQAPRTSAPDAAGGTAPTSAPAAAKSAVTVTFMVPGGTQEDADFKPVFDEFNKRNPNINASYTPAGTGYTPEYTEKLTTMLAGGTAPDVFKTVDNFGALASRGAYLPLDKLVQADPSVGMDDFFSAHVEGSKFEGTLYALPNDGAPQGMWYNVDLFNQAGVPLPTDAWTWDTLLDATKKLTRRDDRGRAQYFGFATPASYLSWIWSNGGDLLDADGKTCILDQPPAVEALTWLQDSVVTHKVAPTPADISEMSTTDMFTGGRLATFIGVRGSLGAFRDIKSFAFDAAPLPKGPKGRVSQLSIGYTSIWSGSKHPDEAFALLKWVCSAEGQRLRISNGFAHPSRKSLVQEDWFKTYKAEKSASFGVNTTFSETLARNEARARAPHPKDAEINTAINRYLPTLYDGSKPAAQVAKAMADDVNKALRG